MEGGDVPDLAPGVPLRLLGRQRRRGAQLLHRRAQAVRVDEREHVDGLPRVALPVHVDLIVASRYPVRALCHGYVKLRHIK